MFDKCKICGATLCEHGSIYCVGNTITCTICDESSEIGLLPTYSLPFYEDEVDFNSQTYFRVCKECHERYTKTIEE